MKYKITTVHGDDFHNIATFETDEFGYKAFKSMLKNDWKFQAFPFVVKNKSKIIYKTKDWEEAYQIHKEFGVKKKNIKCSFCCVSIDK